MWRKNRGGSTQIDPEQGLKRLWLSHTSDDEVALQQTDQNQGIFEEHNSHDDLLLAQHNYQLRLHKGTAQEAITSILDKEKL